MSDLPLIYQFLACVMFLLFIFLLLREYTCWYFKINKMIQMQQEQTDVLNKIYKALYIINGKMPEQGKEEEPTEQP